MKKSLLLTIAAVVLASWATQVIAQESVLFFDIRDNTTTADFGSANAQLISAVKRPWVSGDGDLSIGIPTLTGTINGGANGAGQILRLSPTGSVAHPWENNNAYGAALNNEAWPNYDRDNLLSTGNAWLYLKMNANTDGTPGVNDVYSSMGASLDCSQVLAGTRNLISSISFQLFNSGVGAGLNGAGLPGSPWNNKLDGSLVAAVPPNGPQWTGIKAADVPVDVGPVYNAGRGMVPAAGLYRVGNLRVTAGVQNCSFTVSPNTNAHVKKSTFLYKLRNNSILTTRVFQSGGDATPAENIAYGYTTGFAAGEVANATGSVDNATSATADLVVQIRKKGDADGNGNTDGNDTPTYVGILGSGITSRNVSETYLFDFNHDRSVNGNDTPGFLTALTFGASCP